MTEAWIGLGSNLYDRCLHLRRAVESLEHLGRAQFSSVYETEPVFPPGFPAGSELFLNMVCRIQTELDVLDLFSQLLRIENLNGRTRRRLDNRRTLDLDLLAFGADCFSLGRPVSRQHAAAGALAVPLYLAVPHPRMHVRAFVLTPFSELDSSWEHPLLGRTAGELAASVGQGGVKLRCTYRDLFL